MKVNVTNADKKRLTSKENFNSKSILWIIDGSLKKQLHKNARLKPAIAMANAGWHVQLITAGIPDGYSNGNLIYLKIPWPDIYIYGAIIYYMKVLKKVLFGSIKSDILFFQMDSLALVLLFVPFWQKLIKKEKYTVVTDFRSLPMDTTTTKGRFRGLAFHLGVKFCRYLNIKSTAITEQMAENLKFNQNQLLGLWPSGVDLEDFSDCYSKRHWPKCNDPIRLVYIGVLTAERNLTSVIDAACIAQQKGINLTLSIVGDGVLKERLNCIVKKNNADFILIDGPLAYHEIPGLLSQNDIGILPFPDVPKMNVSSAIKMFEYMAAGMPILATRIQAHKKVFDNQKFVFWCSESPESMAKAIERIFVSKKLLPYMGMEAKKYSKNWSWQESALKLSHALEKVIE